MGRAVRTIRRFRKFRRGRAPGRCPGSGRWTVDGGRWTVIKIENVARGGDDPGKLNGRRDPFSAIGFEPLSLGFTWRRKSHIQNGLGLSIQFSWVATHEGTEADVHSI